MGDGSAVAVEVEFVEGLEDGDVVARQKGVRERIADRAQRLALPPEICFRRGAEDNVFLGLVEPRAGINACGKNAARVGGFDKRAFVGNERRARNGH